MGLHRYLDYSNSIDAEFEDGADVAWYEQMQRERDAREEQEMLIKEQYGIKKEDTVILSKDRKDNLRKLGRECKAFRELLDYTQSEVAQELNVSDKTISAFECGRNDSAILLCWYLRKGFKPGVQR